MVELLDDDGGTELAVEPNRPPPPPPVCRSECKDKGNDGAGPGPGGGVALDDDDGRIWVKAVKCIGELLRVRDGDEEDVGDPALLWETLI